MKSYSSIVNNQAFKPCKFEYVLHTHSFNLSMKIMVDIDYETNKVFFYCDVMFVFEAIPN